MEIRQLSIFLNNEPGSLQKVTQTLSDAGVNLRALSIVDSTDFGLLRIIVDNVDAAITSLEKKKYVVKVNPVLVVQVSDKVGGLSKILELLVRDAINLEYIYAFAAGKEKDKALVLFKFDNNERAAQVLLGNDIPLLSEQDIALL
jgi:hypothetical protein